MAELITFSDLHLFTGRCDEGSLSGIKHAVSDAQYCVLNGDIFDFKWSYFPSVKETIIHAVKWLEDLCDFAPGCNFHYVLGNHDCLADFTEMLDGISRENFSWHATHFRHEDMLFLHGDLPLSGAHPFKRKLVESERHMPPFMDKIYQAIIEMHLHKVINFIFTPGLCSRRIYRAIARHESSMLDGVRHIYFGHTHNGFENFHYKGIYFHNTGSAVKYTKLNILKM